MISIDDLARIIELPEGLDPKYMYVADDPQYLSLVFEGEALKDHPNNRYENCEAPIISFRWMKTAETHWGPLDGKHDA